MVGGREADDTGLGVQAHAVSPHSGQPLIVRLSAVPIEVNVELCLLQFSDSLHQLNVRKVELGCT